MKEKVTKPLAVAMLAGTLLLGSAGIAAADCGAAAMGGCYQNHIVASIQSSQYSIAEWKVILKQLIADGVITSEQADKILVEIITAQSNPSIDPLAVLRDNGQINHSQYNAFKTFTQKHQTINQTASQSNAEKNGSGNQADTGKSE